MEVDREDSKDLPESPKIFSRKSRTKKNEKQEVSYPFKRCPKCPRMLKGNLSLKMHTLRKHTEPSEIRWFCCPLYPDCSYQALTKSEVRVHQKAYSHGSLVDSTIPTRPRTPVESDAQTKCRFCLTNLPPGENPSAHKNRIIVCEKCAHKGKRTRYAQYKHPKLASFNCIHCHYVAQSKGELDRHQLFTKHTTLKYKCAECAIEMRSQIGLEVHLEKSHKMAYVREGRESQILPDEEVLYKCEHCDYRGMDAEEVRRHQLFKRRTHLRQSCPFCSKRLNTQIGLKVHIMFSHKFGL